MHAPIKKALTHVQGRKTQCMILIALDGAIVIGALFIAAVGTIPNNFSNIITVGGLLATVPLAAGGLCYAILRKENVSRILIVVHAVLQSILFAAIWFFGTIDLNLAIGNPFSESCAIYEGVYPSCFQLAALRNLLLIAAFGGCFIAWRLVLLRFCPKYSRRARWRCRL